MANKRYQKILKESYRHNKMDDLVEDVFGGDYDVAWLALVKQASDSEFVESFDYISRMHDLDKSSEDFRQRAGVRHDLAEYLEMYLGGAKEAYEAYVYQMSDHEFRNAEKYIRRMHY